MTSSSPNRFLQFLSVALCMSLLIMFASSVAALAQDAANNKILAGYFEEWSIYGANYNISNLQENGAANHISHLIYAFGNVAPTSGPPNAMCQLADTWKIQPNRLEAGLFIGVVAPGPVGYNSDILC